MSDKKREFRKLQREWYKRLEASGFDDIERSGKNRTKYYDEYSGILKRPQSVLRNKYNLFTYKYYDIASYLGYNAIFLPKIDLKVLELHGKGYTISLCPIRLHGECQEILAITVASVKLS